MKKKMEVHKLEAKEAVRLAEALFAANAAKARFEALCAESLKSRGLESGDWTLNIAEAELRRKEATDGQ